MSFFSIAKRIVRAKVVLVSALGSLAAFAAACSNADKSPAPAPAPKPSQAPVATAAQPSASAPVEVTSADVSDAGAAPDAGYTGPRIGATALVTVVMSDMEWPRDDARKGDKSGKGAVRIGYLRHGARAPVIPERHVKPNCPEGWYELVGGGFVCGRYATLDLNHPRVKLAPHEPDLEGPLPYQYGYNTMNGVPLYRQVPSHDERMKLEPWLSGGSLPSTAESRPASKRKKRGSASGEEASGGSGSSAAAQPGDVQVQNDEADSGAMFGLALASQKTTEEPEVPWYMRDAGGSAKPQVTLDDLRGEGPVARRMVKGFYVALDKQFVSGGWSWWKTTSGLIAPADKLYVQKALTDFKGTWISELPAGSAAATEAGMAPNPLVGWALYKTKKYQIVGKKAVAAEGTVARFTQLKLTGKTGVFGGVRYDETEEGWWLRVNEGTRTKPGAMPKDLAPNEKWVDVNLTTQTLVAYEGDKPAFATLTSTGRRESKEKDYSTPQGTFRIREKHVAATMDGDVATDGPYSIEDVPWIMYFNGSYALHGAFWHAAFGHVKSHGCVNLTPSDARTMFNWTEPHLPEGWHGVNATAEKPGTRVVVHD